jgi:hypothetical protein
MHSYQIEFLRLYGELTRQAEADAIRPLEYTGVFGK